MKIIASNGLYSKVHAKRFLTTIDFMTSLDLRASNILNLGPDNPLSELLRKEGYKITDTEINQDLDLDFEIVKDEKFDVIVAFETIEHLVSPFPLLKSIAGQKLVISVPLSVWFSNAYWNENDPYDRHYHEFEPKQLKMLLNKAGWKITKEEKHVIQTSKFGIRPLLRKVFPSYYFVYCEREANQKQ